MRVILARHGHTKWNEEARALGHTDLSLSPRGRAEAAALAAALVGEPITRFHSSDLRRCVETAAAVAGTEEGIRRHDGLRELHQGMLEGLPIGSMFDEHPDVGKRWLADPVNCILPGGESMGLLQARVVRAFEEAVATPWEETLFVASHNLAISSLLAHLTGSRLDRFRDWYHLPCAYSVLEGNGAGWKVVEHNVRDHVEDLHA